MPLRPEDFGASVELHRAAFHPDEPTCIWCEPGSTAMLPEEGRAADNDRLRALIKAAERAGGDMASGLCPWCRSWVQHSLTCVAFRPNGDVR